MLNHHVSSVVTKWSIHYSPTVFLWLCQYHLASNNANLNVASFVCENEDCMLMSLSLILVSSLSLGSGIFTFSTAGWLIWWIVFRSIRSSFYVRKLVNSACPNSLARDPPQPWWENESLSVVNCCSNVGIKSILQEPQIKLKTITPHKI